MSRACHLLSHSHVCSKAVALSSGKAVRGKGGEGAVPGRRHDTVQGCDHCSCSSPQGGLGVFVQLMPILILILVSALSQLMVSSPPYSLSPRP